MLASGGCFRERRIGRTPTSLLIESHLEVIQKQLARLAGTAFRIISATMMLTRLSLRFFLPLGACAGGRLGWWETGQVHQIFSELSDRLPGNAGLTAWRAA